MYLEGMLTDEELREREAYQKWQWANENIDRLFAEFWVHYPKKVNKANCKVKFKKLLDNALIKGIDEAVNLVGEIMAGLARWKRSSTWLNDNGEYICHPMTWLNQERWKDETKDHSGNGKTPMTANQSVRVDYDLPY